MKKSIFVLIIFAFALKACAQIAPFNGPVTFNDVTTFNKTATFTVAPNFKAGFILNGKLYTDIPTVGTLDWAGITNKPSVFPPSAHTHVMSDITDFPLPITLSDAIEQMGYLPIPQRTTTELSAIIPATGKSGIVYDKTVGFYKLWDGKAWSKIVTTNQ